MSQELITLAERYALEALVAEGGMATVWRARDEVLARTVAVKILHPHLAKDDSFIERFRREALAAARLTHPNIVSIFDTGTEDEAGHAARHFIVMEFCGGGTLADLGAGEPLSPERVIGVGAAICSALAYAHENGVIHRDMKPANALLSNDGTLKVGDFGIAKAAFTGREITTTGSLLGTVTYISPEQARGEEPDTRSDLYSLGVVLYELLVGRPPFSGDTAIATAMKHVDEEPAPPRSIRAGVPRALEAVILKALSKDPADRFASAERMREQLLRCGRSDETAVIRVSQTARPVETPPQSHGDARWVAWVVALIASAILVAVAVNWFVGPNENGGDSTEPRGAAQVQIASAKDYDPHGGDSEHPEVLRLAFDKNPGTAWTTEDYNDPFSEEGKPGVGIYFDLGESVEISRVEVNATPGISFDLRVAEQVGPDEDSFTTLGSEESVEAMTTVEIDGEQGRYWLVWITSLPDGGAGEAGIAEVKFFGG